MRRSTHKHRVSRSIPGSAVCWVCLKTKPNKNTHLIVEIVHISRPLPVDLVNRPLWLSLSQTFVRSINCVSQFAVQSVHGRLNVRPIARWLFAVPFSTHSAQDIPVTSANLRTAGLIETVQQMSHRNFRQEFSASHRQNENCCCWQTQHLSNKLSKEQLRRPRMNCARSVARQLQLPGSNELLLAGKENNYWYWYTPSNTRPSLARKSEPRFNAFSQSSNPATGSLRLTLIPARVLYACTSTPTLSWQFHGIAIPGIELLHGTGNWKPSQQYCNTGIGIRWAQCCKRSNNQ